MIKGEYDFCLGNNTDRAGERVTREQFRALAKRSGARSTRAGETTLRQAVLIQSLVSRTSEAMGKGGIFQALFDRADTPVEKGDMNALFVIAWT